METTAAEELCPRTALTPYWDNPAEAGNKLRVSMYICDICGRRFSPEEGERLTMEGRQHARLDEA